MSVRLLIAAMLYLMVQAVLFFTVTLIVLLTPLSGDAIGLMPWVVAGTSLVSLPVSWWLAPRLRARTWREEGTSELLR
jgi:hypothetical protein